MTSSRATDVERGVAALRRVAFLLERELAESHRVKAFRTAANTVLSISAEDVMSRVDRGTLADLPGIGPKTSAVFVEYARGGTSPYLAELEAKPAPDPGRGVQLQSALRGDLHVHSDWSDGGSPIRDMAVAASGLGHEYAVLTDHSPTLKVANGLSPGRLRKQLDEVDRVNAELAPFRLLTGIEVDILEDGTLDQEPELLERLDVVVASVHSKLRSPGEAMTRRMVTAIANPHMNVLGHCTGRLVAGGRKRPESEFEADLVFEACRRFGVAVEINCRPERRDPPRRLIRQALERGCLFSIDTDAHAPGQLDWQAYGCARAAECGVTAERVINTWSADDLLAWCAARPRVD